MSLFIPIERDDLPKGTEAYKISSDISILDEDASDELMTDFQAIMERIYRSYGELPSAMEEETPQHEITRIIVDVSDIKIVDDSGFLENLASIVEIFRITHKMELRLVGANKKITDIFDLTSQTGNIATQDNLDEWLSKNKGLEAAEDTPNPHIMTPKQQVDAEKWQRLFPPNYDKKWFRG